MSPSRIQAGARIWHCLEVTELNHYIDSVDNSIVMASVFWQGHFCLQLDNESKIENSGMCKFLFIFFYYNIMLYLLVFELCP